MSQVTYNNLLESAFNEIPQLHEFYMDEKEKNLLDDDSGVHIVFGFVVVPFVINALENNDERLLKILFSFLEKMALCNDVLVGEVLDFTILESLADEPIVLEKAKSYMEKETLLHYLKIQEHTI